MGGGGKSREDGVTRAPPGWGLASCRNTQFIPQAPTMIRHCAWPLHLSAQADSGREECESDQLILAKTTGELPTSGAAVSREILLLHTKLCLPKTYVEALTPM